VKLIILFLFISQFCFTWAKDIKLLIADQLPPYTFKNQNKGIEYDIVKEALAYKGHKFIPTYVPFGRLHNFVRFKSYDGALTINKSHKFDKFFLSDVYIIYQNQVVTLDKRNLFFDSYKDFKGKKVISFHNSTTYLGLNYKNAIKECFYYNEMHNQKNQVLMLLRNRVDAIVIDKNIFLHHYGNLNKNKKEPKFRLHSFFEPTEYRLLLKNKEIVNDFNEGLQYLKSTGRYDQIISTYQGKIDLK